MDKLQKLDFSDRLHSHWNSWMYRVRQTMQFQRCGYKEENINCLFAENGGGSTLRQSLEDIYGFAKYRNSLRAEVYLKNLVTLWSLEAVFKKVPLPINGGKVLEPGCQDFSRLPAIYSFLQMRGMDCNIVGLEIDAYPILDNLHSRLDKAKYYSSLIPGKSTFQSGNFFQLQEKFNLILCFYPFVSPHPALAWGLPAEFGNGALWLQAIDRCLEMNGNALLVHQGDWEEEEFDLVRSQNRNGLELVERMVLDCPFAPAKYAPHGSIYRKAK